VIIGVVRKQLLQQADNFSPLAVKTISFEKTDVKHPLPIFLTARGPETDEKDNILWMCNPERVGIKNVISYIKYLMRTEVSSIQQFSGSPSQLEADLSSVLLGHLVPLHGVFGGHRCHSVRIAAISRLALHRAIGNYHRTLVIIWHLCSSSRLRTS
jgi:hypothetical protein